MNNNEKTKTKAALKAAVIVLVAALVISGSFLIGKKNSDTRYEKERNENVEINLSDLEGLGNVDGTIYVTGHKSPDSDAVCSAIAYADLLQKVGYDAKPVVLGPLNKETAFILETVGAEAPPVLEDASGKNMVLVDHSEYTQSANGLSDANVLSIIDHHGDGSVTTGNQFIYDARPLGATASIIYIRYGNYGLTPDKKISGLLLGALLSDTDNLKANTTTSADRIIFGKLKDLSGIKDTDAFYDEMHRAYISHEGMSEEEIFLNDYREYEVDGRSFAIGCIDAYDTDDAENLSERMRNIMPEVLSSGGMEFGYAQIGVHTDDIDASYIVASDDTAKEILKAAFNDDNDFEGNVFIISPSISRKKTLVPAITEVMQSHPKE